MLKRYLLLFGMLAILGCKKGNNDPKPDDTTFTDPEMTYIDLTGKSVAMGQSLALDFDGNKKIDMLFYTELHSIDLNTKTARVYLLGGGVACNLAANLSNDTTPDLPKGNFISQADIPGHAWYPVLTFTLMRHITAGAQTYWEGSWKDRDHRYLPFELMIQGQKHLGWVELFADTQTDKLVFYRAAISKTPQARIRAGY